jgi:hypothetical protein
VGIVSFLLKPPIGKDKIFNVEKLILRLQADFKNGLMLQEGSKDK